MVWKAEQGPRTFPRRYVQGVPHMTLVDVQKWDMRDPVASMEERCTCGHSRESHWHSFCDGTGTGELDWCRTTCGCKEYRGPEQSVKDCECGCPRDNHQLRVDGEGMCKDCDCMKYRPAYKLPAVSTLRYEQSKPVETCLCGHSKGAHEQGHYTSACTLTRCFCTVFRPD